MDRPGTRSLAVLRLLSPQSWIVALLLALHVVLAFSAVCTKSNTFDEIIHITGGYSYWTTGDFRLNAESGILPQRLMSLPLLFSDLHFPPLDQGAWRKSRAYVIGQQFFYQSGNDPEAILRRSRAVMMLLSVALGLLVYAWSRRLFGSNGALVSLTLYAFNPAFLANGALATMDVAASLFFLACVGCFWRMIHDLNPWTMTGSVLTTGLLFVTKMSAPLVVPVLMALFVMRVVDGRPVVARLRTCRQIRQPAALSGIVAAWVIAVAAATAMLIWMMYGFHYPAFRSAEVGRDGLRTDWQVVLDSLGALRRPVLLAKDYHLLPEGYLFGFAFTQAAAQARPAFLNGEFALRGWPSFFPYCFAVKTPLAVFGIAGLAMAAAARRWREVATLSGMPLEAIVRQRLYRTAPLWALCSFYFAAAISSHLNIGHRHILPIYPPLFILAGAAAFWARAPHRLKRTILAALLLATVAEGMYVWPNYLAYFNVLAGGSSQGYRHLVDSSLDWGQDLPALKRWLERQSRDQEPIFLSYFGTASPSWYGIRARRLPGYGDGESDDVRRPILLEAGIYCISATQLQQVYSSTPGRWTPERERQYRALLRQIEAARTTEDGSAGTTLLQAAKPETQVADLQFNRLCNYLVRRTPDDSVGYSILIYRLNKQQIDQALYGASD